ncbi:retrovirus-related pol polyprotein from transposon TNT 1-94 [Tanacetum coccineum]|uniref:Retrovirus-related pol polyprotein from transposon TNT 1-94 n=1 Tax=Tanacetum coccineum TaxID=301880 RepID=A0ABQ5BTP9_9ASTR
MTLQTYFEEESITHQTSIAQTTEHNGIVERQNRALVEVARTILSASNLLLFLWAKAIATACYTQNRSLIIPRHEKTPYHIINNRKPNMKYLHIFGCICYIVRDGENLVKMKEKGEASPSTSTPVAADSTQLNVHTTPGSTTPTPTVNAGGNNNQTVGARFDKDEFINPFGIPISEAAETSSRNVDPSNMHTFYQRYPSKYHWTKDHPLEQVLKNPTKPV